MKISGERRNLRCLLVVIAALGWTATGRSAEPAARPQLWFATDFDGTNALGDWSGAGTLAEGYQSSRGLRVERPAVSTSSAAMMVRQLPVAEVRGCTILASARIRAEGVSVPPQTWNGIKFMVALAGSGQKTWPQARLGTGSFDWQRVAFSVRVPEDATSANLYLGLEEVTGTVWFDDVKLVVQGRPRPRPAPVAGPMYKGHSLPRLRGTMVGSDIDAAGLKVLGRDWNANLIRWQLIRSAKDGASNLGSDYEEWLASALKRFDAILPACEEAGLMVVLDLHSPPGGKATPGGYYGSDDRLFTDPKAQEQFVEVWRRIATRYRATPAIWGYDLANEPVEEWVDEGCDDWHTLAERTARAIRAIDPARTLIVEAPPWGSPDSLAEFTPLAVSNVVYSAHMYVPMEFTHQGVFERGNGPVDYPGVIKGQRWDKSALEATLAPVLRFQQRYNVHIFLGEFSAIRWAPGDSGERYLRDLTEIFESHGWDWTYHAFREWHGWSVEHGGDRTDTRPVAEPSARQRVLRHWFDQNKHPPR